MQPHTNLPDVVKAAHALSAGLVNPCLLVTLHRDIDELHGKDGTKLGRSRKQYALRWAVFSMSYAAVEAFFNDVLGSAASSTRHLQLTPDKLRNEAQRQGVKLFTNQWGVRTRTASPHVRTNRSVWKTYVGSVALRDYLADMKKLRDLLSHGGDPYTTSNASGALWPLAAGRHSMRLMGAEGFIQACTDLATQSILAYGGDLSQAPDWPEPRRTTLSSEKRPALPLLP